MNRSFTAWFSIDQVQQVLQGGGGGGWGGRGGGAEGPTENHTGLPKTSLIRAKPTHPLDEASDTDIITQMQMPIQTRSKQEANSLGAKLQTTFVVCFFI